MDHAVSLVQAYLEINGYFTVAEFPVLSSLPGGGFTSATDVDLLALRLCSSGGVATAGGDRPAFEPDAALEVPAAGADLLLIEVKEGRAELNRGAKDPAVLRAVLGRFGLGSHDRVARSLRDLERDGETTWPGNVHVRMFAVGSIVDPKGAKGYRTLSLAHVTQFVTGFIEENWDELRHAQIRHEAFGFLALLEQVRRSVPAEPELPETELPSGRRR